MTAIAQPNTANKEADMKSISDGSTADYYQLPKNAAQLQDLISYRNLNAQDGEIFRAIYRKGRASHSSELRDAKKVLFYAQAEVDRLELIETSKKIILQMEPKNKPLTVSKPEGCIDINEVAEITGLTINTIRSYLKKHTIVKPKKHKHRIFWTLEDITHWDSIRNKNRGAKALNRYNYNDF